MDVNDTGAAATQPGIELTSTGNGLALTGTVDVAMQSNKAIDINGAALAGTFANVTTTASTAGGVRLTNTSGSLTFENLALTTSGITAAFQLSASPASTFRAVTSPRTSPPTAGPAVHATGLTFGTDLVFDTITVTGNPTRGINFDGTSSYTFSAGSGSSIGATSVVGFDFNGGSGTVTYPGSIANGTGEAVDVTGRTGDTTFSGNITGTGGTGINVSGNSRRHDQFQRHHQDAQHRHQRRRHAQHQHGRDDQFHSGGLDIDTTRAPASAPPAAAPSRHGAGNTINSATGTALNVANTTIGDAD